MGLIATRDTLVRSVGIRTSPILSLNQLTGGTGAWRSIAAHGVTAIGNCISSCTTGAARFASSMLASSIFSYATSMAASKTRGSQGILVSPNGRVSHTCIHTGGP